MGIVFENKKNAAHHYIFRTHSNNLSKHHNDSNKKGSGRILSLFNTLTLAHIE